MDYFKPTKSSAYLQKPQLRSNQPGVRDIDEAVQELLSHPVDRRHLDATVRKWFRRTGAQPDQALMALAEAIGEQWVVPVDGVFTLICYLLDHYWRPPPPEVDIKELHRLAKASRV